MSSTRAAEPESPVGLQGAPARGLVGVAGWEHALLAALFLASMIQLVLLPPTIHGDGVGYLAYLRSALFDHDLNFANEYQHFGQRTTMQMLDPGPTSTGLVHNVWTVGPALLWGPFYLLGHLVALALGLLGWQGGAEGYSAPYVYSIAVASALYGFGGLLLTYGLCRRSFGTADSLLALALVWLATSLPAYMYFHPSLSHAASFFLVASFLSLWWNGRGSLSARRYAALGLLAGLMAATRLQNVLFLLPVVAYEACSLAVRLRARDRSEQNRRRVAEVARWALGWGVLAGAALLTFAPQMIAWWVLYGKPLANPYTEYPSGAGFAWANPRVWDVLFSSKHGLVSWTPVVGFALLGLTLRAFRGDGLARVLGGAFLLQLYLVGAWSNWWQGASFGGRMFIELSPAFALGLAAIALAARRFVPPAALWVVASLLILWNLLFVLQYGTGALPLEDFVSWEEVVRNQVTYSPRLLLAMAGRLGPGPWIGLLAAAASATALYTAQAVRRRRR